MKIVVFVVSLFFLSLPFKFSSAAPIPPIPKTINLNQASASELSHAFKGIGQKRAQAIVAFREAHGPFKSINDLAQVRGFSKLFVSKQLEEMKKIFVL